MRELQITQSITRRETRSLEAYLQETRKISLVSPEEEILLAQKIRQGDRAALERLVGANLRFVVSVAKKYQHLGVPLSDLINEGNLGLIKAAERFDETRGFKFISFAVWWIRQSIMLSIGDHQRMVRLPMNSINLLTRIGFNLCTLESKLERQPTTTELAEFLELEPRQVADARFYSGQTVSYDKPLSPEDEYALIDQLESSEPPPDHLVASPAVEAESKARALLCTLNADERMVLTHRFGLDGGREMTNREIAGMMGCYPEKVRLIANAALNKLRAKCPGLLLS